MHAGVLDSLRTGGWLTYERVRRIAVALIFAYVVAVGYLVVTANGSVAAPGDRAGPIFSNGTPPAPMCSNASRRPRSTLQAAITLAVGATLYGCGSAPHHSRLRLLRSACQPVAKYGYNYDMMILAAAITFLASDGSA